MKIAIFLFGNRISPRFDCAPSLLLITTDRQNNAVVEKNEQPIQGKDYLEIIKQLKNAAVDIVICGGITNDMLEMLEENDTEVIPWVSGDAQKALQLFMQGKLFPGAILCPGRRTRQWGFCRQTKKRPGRQG